MLQAHLKLLRFLAILLVLACQVGAFSTLDNAAGSETATLGAASVLCHSSPHKDAPSPHRHHLDQVVVDPAVFGSQFAALVDGIAGVPQPVSGCIGTAVTRPGARAPPARYVSAFFPRGPPNLV